MPFDVPRITIRILDGGLSAGTIAPPDGPMWVLGTCSQGQTTPFSTSQAQSLKSEFGYGPAVEGALYALNNELNQITFLRVDPTDQAEGSYGSITVNSQGAGITVTGDGTVKPGDDWNPLVEFTTGGTIGTSGIKYRYSLDGGNKFSGERDLGTETSITLPNGGGKYVLSLPADALVARATELRSDMLAHFADATAHNSADAVSAALITDPAPINNTAAIAVTNQCRLAMISHLDNVASHDSYDRASLPNTSPATTEFEALALLLVLSAAHELHRIVAIAALPSGLVAPAATSASPTSVLRAALSGIGLAQIESYPSRLTVTTSGGTPSDAPATVDIFGFDANGNPQSEIGLALSQVSGSVTSALYYSDFAATAFVYPAGDGVGATVAIGIGPGVHNSPDATNTITTPDPVGGDIIAGDSFSLLTTAPRWHIDQLVAAIALVKNSTLACNGVLEIVGNVLTNSEAQAIEDALEGLGEKYRDVRAVGHYRARNIGESLQSYAAAYAAAHPIASASGRQGRLTLTAWYYPPSQLVPGGATARPYAFAAAPRLARTELATNAISEVDFGAVKGALRASDDTVLPRGVDESYEAACTPVRLWAPRSDPSGILASRPVTLAPEGSDFALIHYGRVIDAVKKSAYLSLKKRMGQKVAPKPGTVYVDPNEAKRVQDAETKRLDQVFVKTGQADGVRVVFDLTSVVSGAGTKLAKFAIFVRPVGYIEDIEANLQFSLA